MFTEAMLVRGRRVSLDRRRDGPRDTRSSRCAVSGPSSRSRTRCPVDPGFHREWGTFAGDHQGRRIRRCHYTGALPGRPEKSAEMRTSMMDRPKIAITMGDAAGVGPEIIMKSLAHAGVYERCRPL